MLMACASSTPPSRAISPPPADLAQPCEPLAPLADGIAATVLRWAVATVEQYQDCQRRHGALVRAWPQ